MWKIVPPTFYVKKWKRFRTTTNRIKIAISANRPLVTHESKMCEQNAIYLGKSRGALVKLELGGSFQC